MGRKAVEKGALQVQRLVKPGLHFVGGVDGLALQVLPTGGRSWILRMTVGKARRDMGLGGYPDVPLSQAREAARQARAKVRLGLDPIEEGKAAKSRLLAAQASAKTFKECAQAYIKAHEAGWRNGKNAGQWNSSLETYAYPVLGELLVRDIELSHIKSVLDPIWREKTVTASRLRGRLESVINWAITSGYRSGDNPARWRGHLDNLLPAPNKIKNEKHYPPVQVSQVGQFMKDLRAKEGMGARALEFTALTAARSGEVRGAVWSEIDFKERLWTVPASRMKSGVEHRKPLSDAAIDLLRALPRIADCEYVFFSPRGGTLSDMTLSQLMRRMEYVSRDGRVAVPHGLRGTFKVWASERTNYTKDVVEMALAHTLENKTEAAYFDSDLLAKRALMMADWAKFCAAPMPSSVVVDFQEATQAAA